MKVTAEREIGRHKLSLTTGELAKQASGAVLVQYGETVLLVVAQTGPGRPGLDFFPLTVDHLAIFRGICLAEVIQQSATAADLHQQAALLATCGFLCMFSIFCRMAMCEASILYVRSLNSISNRLFPEPNPVDTGYGILVCQSQVLGLAAGR